jgi:hypothetical protein
MTGGDWIERSPHALKQLSRDHRRRLIRPHGQRHHREHRAVSGTNECRAPGGTPPGATAAKAIRLVAVG